jgi:hypothetical protein
MPLQVGENPGGKRDEKTHGVEKEQRLMMRRV